ncbi:MAG: hypothetical protein OEY93_06630 [Anaerolineae bacterium]|nr:hypothetical protein [Anaerolineae bacterium]
MDSGGNTIGRMPPVFWGALAFLGGIILAEVWSLSLRLWLLLALLPLLFMLVPRLRALAAIIFPA